MAGQEPGANALVELSEAMAAAVERAAASTVTVDARKRIPASGIVWTGDGVIVTSNHVVERDEDIMVTGPDGNEVAAKLAGRDPGSDIAVLRAEAGSWTPAERVPEGEARVGHFVLALGRPGEGGPQASVGVISAMGGAWRTFRGGQVDGYIRTDATLYPGFSGGPLVDGAGRVAGINSSGLARGSGLTIPAWAMTKIVDALLTGGRIKRGYLGIGSQQARLPAALAARLDGQESGLLVVAVEPGSPAEHAGMMLGDILVSLAGAKVMDTGDLQGLLGPDTVGTAVPAKVLRGGEPSDLTVTVGERE
jgi:S1-C subfamily serine protease